MELVPIALTVGLLDMGWLTLRYNYHANLFQSVQGSKLEPRMAPALLIYVLIPLAVYIWAVQGKKTVREAMLNGALVGAILYAFYDLTNYATLRGWTLEMTITDILWGIVVCTLGAAAGFSFSSQK
jgi:uncharacterized membrane protein